MRDREVYCRRTNYEYLAGRVDPEKGCPREQERGQLLVWGAGGSFNGVTSFEADSARWQPELYRSLTAQARRPVAGLPGRIAALWIASVPATGYNLLNSCAGAQRRMRYRLIADGQLLNKETRRALLVILGATLLLKLIVVLVVMPKVGEHLPYSFIGGFTDRYDRIAENLLAGNGYRIDPDTSETLLRGPGYVFLLAGLFYLFGKSIAAAQVFNILCGLATAYLIVLITKRWIMPEREVPAGGHAIEWAPLVPAVVFLFHPGIILSESRGAGESLFTVLFTAVVYLLYRSIRSNGARDFMLTGFVLGLAMLVKSTPALIPIVFFPYFLVKAKPWGVSYLVVVRNFVIMGLAAFIVLAPWGVRNYFLTGEFLLSTTVKGTTADQGLYVNKNFGSGKDRDVLLNEATRKQDAVADELGLEHRFDFFNLFYSAKDEVRFDRYLFEQVVKEYKASPALLLKSCILNFSGFWFLGKSEEATYLNVGLTVPLLLLAGWGIISGFRRGFDIVPLVLVMCAFIAPHLPILGVARYHIPLIPFLAILATIPFINVNARKVRA